MLRMGSSGEETLGWTLDRTASEGDSRDGTLVAEDPEDKSSKHEDFNVEGSLESDPEMKNNSGGLGSCGWISCVYCLDIFQEKCYLGDRTRGLQ